MKPSSFGNLPTPLPILRSSCGSLCYTTVDLQATIKGPYLVQNEIADTVGKSFGNTSLQSLLKRNNSINNVNADILSARHMDSGLWSCTASGVKISTNAGMKQVSVTDYMDRLERDNPSFVFALADEVAYTSTRKRLETSMTRTSEWLKQMCSKNSGVNSNNNDINKNKGNGQGKATRPPVDHNILPTEATTTENEFQWNDKAALVGVVLPYHVVGLAAAAPEDIGSSEFTQREAEHFARAEHRFLEHLRQVLACGAKAVCVGGLGLGESFEVRGKAISAVKSALVAELESEANDTATSNNKNMPIVVHGMNSLAEVLHAVLNGADVVATNLPSVTTKLGHAIAWRVDPPASASASATEVVVESGTGSRKRKLSEEEMAQSQQAQDGVINLWDERYKEDPGPLLPGCDCHACRHHSRRYVRHLLQAHELLGEVLLYTHNQHQVVQLFDSVRQHCAAGTLEQWAMGVTQNQV